MRKRELIGHDKELNRSVSTSDGVTFVEYTGHPYMSHVIHKKTGEAVNARTTFLIKVKPDGAISCYRKHNFHVDGIEHFQLEKIRLSDKEKGPIPQENMERLLQKIMREKRIQLGEISAPSAPVVSFLDDPHLQSALFEDTIVTTPKNLGV